MKKLITMSLVLSIVFALGLAGTAEADPYAVGDIFAAVNSGNVQHYSSAGVLLETLNTGQGGFTTGMAFDSTGNLYVTNFSASSVTNFAGPGDPHTSSLFGGGYSTPEAIVFDAAGNAYVGNLSDGIRKYDSAGNYLSSVLSSTRIDWIDLAADQTTMLYTQEGSVIKTVDVTTGISGSDFAGGLTQAFALRILSDGGVLVADLNNVKRFNSAGTLIQSYDVAGEDSWFSLNLNPDGTSFWSGNFGTGIAYEFDIASGAMTQTLNTGVGYYNLFGLAIYGEVTQGGGGGKVPEPGTMILLGSGLIGMGLFRRFNKRS